MTEPEPPRAEAVDPELVRERQRAQLEVYRANSTALDAVEATTMRQKMAFARALAVSDLVPAGFRAGVKPGMAMTERQIDVAAASIVLAQGWGEHLGFRGLAWMHHLHVIEGRVALREASARGMIFAAGCDLDDDVTYSDAGFPVAHTVTITRPGLKPKSASFTLVMALQAELISEIRTDTAGTVIGVTALSEKRNPLPWQKYTGDMLRHRATGRMVNAYAMDITGGMDLAPELAEPVVPAAPPGPRPSVAATMERVAGEQPAAPAEGEEYDPTDDLALIEQATGQADPSPWWEHADAPARLGIKRRTKVQLAADRISAWVQEHPGEAEGISPPGLVRADEGDGLSVWRWDPDPDGVVEAEIVDDPPADLMGTEPTPVTPFRDEPVAGPLAGVEDVDLPAWEPEPVAGPAAEPARPSEADLLAVLTALAEKDGKTLAQYLIREIALHRKNPEDWTWDQLAAVVEKRSGVSLAELIGQQ
jgi:hypothetical protein